MFKAEVVEAELSAENLKGAVLIDPFSGRVVVRDVFFNRRGDTHVDLQYEAGGVVRQKTYDGRLSRKLLLEYLYEDFFCFPLGKLLKNTS